MVSTTYAPSAKGQGAKELEPSLRMFHTVSTPMPDFRRAAFYQAFPDSQGGSDQGMGNSGWIKGWFLQMEPMRPRFVAIDNRLRQDVDVYGDTVREEGGKVLNATANLRKSLADLDRGTSGKVQDLLAQYNDEVTSDTRRQGRVRSSDETGRRGRISSHRQRCWCQGVQPLSSALETGSAKSRPPGPHAKWADVSEYCRKGHSGHVGRTAGGSGVRHS